VIGYVLALAVFGAPGTEVPESPSGVGQVVTSVVRPVPLEPVLIVVASAASVIIGVVVRMRGARWGLYVAWGGSVLLTIVGAIFIFGVFGPILIASLALLPVLVVFTWFGRGVHSSAQLARARSRSG